MRDKLTKIIKHLVYALVSNVLYGFIVYFLYMALVGYSLLYVYLVNLALIILFLALDDVTLKAWESKRVLALIKKEKDIEKGYRTIQLYFDSFVSFKTILYVFYVFILIVAQMIDFYPALISEGLTNFIFANRYSILILIAFDQLIGQFSKDRGRMKKISEKLKKDLFDDQD